jgi:hypothetical protein
MKTSTNRYLPILVLHEPSGIELKGLRTLEDHDTLSTRKQPFIVVISNPEKTHISSSARHTTQQQSPQTQPTPHSRNSY